MKSDTKLVDQRQIRGIGETDYVIFGWEMITIRSQKSFLAGS